MPTYLPLASSPAGLCLTAKNWQDSGITTLAFDLDSLLIKPGLDLLMQIPHFGHYMGWSGRLILNARKILSNKEGSFTLVSPFDGSKINITLAQLKALIIHINPEAVLLPDSLGEEYPEFLDSWPQTITPLISNEGVEWIVSDQPAQMGMEAKVFTSKGIMDLKEEAAAKTFEVIEADCQCPTCKENLSQAYLHHLYAHTPLLCQRFLIMHNVFFTIF